MSWTHFGDTKPKARKEHICELCALSIPKGMEHVARRGANDGYVDTFRMHIDCERVTRRWREDDWECGIDHGEFRKELAEFLAANAPRDGETTVHADVGTPNGKGMSE